MTLATVPPMWLAIGAAGLWTIWTVCLKLAVDRIGAPLTTVISVAVEMFVAVVIFVPMATVPAVDPGRFKVGVVLACVGGLAGLGGLWLYNEASKTSLAVASPVAHSYIALAVLVGFVVLREHVGARELIGIGFVLGGLSILVTKGS